CGVWLMLQPASSQTRQPKTPVTLDVVSADRARAITPIWSPSGDKFIYNEADTLRLVDCATAKESSVVRLTRLPTPAVRPHGPPALDWTNGRLTGEPVQWFPSGKELLVSEGGDLFIVPIDGSAFTQLPSTADAEQDAKLSPDGKQVGFRRGHDLYTL